MVKKGRWALVVSVCTKANLALVAFAKFVWHLKMFGICFLLGYTLQSGHEGFIRVF